MGIQEDLIKQKINDINSIDFGNTVEEVSSSMMIIMTLFEIDDDPEILKACKLKLYEGIALLKRYGAMDKAQDIEEKVKD